VGGGSARARRREVGRRLPVIRSPRPRGSVRSRQASGRDSGLDQGSRRAEPIPGSSAHEQVVEGPDLVKTPAPPSSCNCTTVTTCKRFPPRPAARHDAEAGARFRSSTRQPVADSLARTVKMNACSPAASALLRTQPPRLGDGALVGGEGAHTKTTRAQEKEADPRRHEGVMPARNSRSSPPLDVFTST